MFKNMKALPKALILAVATGALVFGGKFVLDATGVTKSKEIPNAREAQRAPQEETKVSSLFSKAVSVNSLQSIVDTGVVRISAQSPSKPFFSVERGQPQGFNYDFLKLVFAQDAFTSKHARIQINADETVDTYAAVPEALLKSSTVHLAIDGLTFNDQDLDGVVYTVPYVDDFGYSLITASNTMVRNVDEVNSMTIGILKGDPDVKAYVQKQFPQAKLVELSDASTSQGRTWISDFIGAGKVDGIVYDYPFAAAEIAGTDLQFAVSKLPASNLKYKIGVRKDDVQLLEALNAGIRKAKANPEYTELIKKYFMSSNIAKVTAAAKTETVYVVKKGDTLSTIAQVTLGDRMRYSDIETRNNLPNPNLIQVGQKLVIPKA